MRSLTHSSAGLSIPTPFISSLSSHIATNTSMLPEFVSLPCRSTPQTRHGVVDSHNLSAAPNPMTINRPSFFDVGSNSALLSARAKNGVTHAIHNSWSKTTLGRYTGAIQQYIDFCITENIPENLRFPADEFVLCAFAASSAGKHAGSTPRARLSAIKAWHLAHNMEWKGSSRLRYVLNGVSNLAPGSSHRPPRPPINSKMLTQLVSYLDLKLPFDAAVAACAAVAFWGQCRLGELLPATSSFPSSSLLPI